MFDFDENDAMLLLLVKLKGAILMNLKTELVTTSYINDFKTFKLNGMIRDVKRLSTEELILVKKEIESILTYEEQSIYE